MDIDLAQRALTLYIWALAAALLLALYGIARFYQRTAGERSFYQLFLLPLALFLAAGLRSAWTGRFGEDIAADVLLFLGGISLFAVGYYLHRLMMGRRHP